MERLIDNMGKLRWKDQLIIWDGIQMERPIDNMGWNTDGKTN